VAIWKHGEIGDVPDYSRFWESVGEDGARNGVLVADERGQDASACEAKFESADSAE
jgi:hypothetical protein